MSEQLDRVRKELELVGWEPDFDYDDEDGDASASWGNMCGDSVLELFEVFSKQGHSGASASFTANYFNELVKGNTLSPLTGEDDEWIKLDYNDDTCYQNKRCFAVFKNVEGKAYYIDRWVFVEQPDGCSFTSNQSKMFIEFPYTPETTYIDVVKDQDLSNFDSQRGVFDPPVTLMEDTNEDTNFDYGPGILAESISSKLD